MTAPAAAPLSFVRVKTQFENLGDALIVGELVQLLREQGDVVVATGAAPDGFVASMRLDRASGKGGTVRVVGTGRYWSTMARELLLGRRPRAVLMPGGIEGEIGPRHRWRMRLMTWLLALCRLAGLTIIQMGLSYDRLGPRLASAVKERVRHLRLHLVREQGSLEYARGQGIRVDGVLPDLAYAAFATPSPAAGMARDAIGVSFRWDKTASGPERVGTLAETVARRSPQAPILCVVQVARDLAGMQALAAALRERGCAEVSVIDCHHDMAAAEQAYARCTTVFSNRLHVLLLAARQGAVPVPILTPGVDRKIERVWADLGLPDVIRFIDVWAGEVPEDAAAVQARAIEMSARLRRGLSESLESTLPDFRTTEHP